MWAVAKFDKKQINFFKKDLKKKLGENFVIYTPKILLNRFSKKKFIHREFNILGDYLLCFHNEFNNPLTINRLKHCRGLKYFLPGNIQSQNEITNFVNKCKKNVITQTALCSARARDGKPLSGGHLALREM